MSPSDPGCGQEGVQRGFELGQQHVGIRYGGLVTHDHPRGYPRVGAGRHGDLVLPVGVHHDQGYSGRGADGGKAGGVHAFSLEKTTCGAAEVVIAYRADEADVRAQTACGNRLVGSLTSRAAVEGPAEHRPAGPGQVVGLDNEVPC